jgi:hypothetical protein
MIDLADMPVADQLRDALKRDARPAVEIAKSAGIHPVNLSHFKSGTRGLSLAAMEKLAAALGLEITVKKIPGKRT